MFDRNAIGPGPTANSWAGAGHLVARVNAAPLLPPLRVRPSAAARKDRLGSLALRVAVPRKRTRPMPSASFPTLRDSVGWAALGSGHQVLLSAGTSQLRLAEGVAMLQLRRLSPTLSTRYRPNHAQSHLTCVSSAASSGQRIRDAMLGSHQRCVDTGCSPNVPRYIRTSSCSGTRSILRPAATSFPSSRAR